MTEKYEWLVATDDAEGVSHGTDRTGAIVAARQSGGTLYRRVVGKWEAVTVVLSPEGEEEVDRMANS